jgi:hypothetical protein
VIDQAATLADRASNLERQGLQAGALILPLLFSELTGNVVTFAKDIFDVGRDLGGPDINDADINPLLCCHMCTLCTCGSRES